MSEPCTTKLSPRGQAIVDQIIAHDAQLAAYHAGQIVVDFGPAEVRTKIQEVLPPVKLAPHL